MTANHSPLNRQTARRFGRAVKNLLTSEVRGKAIGLLLFLLLFAVSVSGLNVVNSYVGRDFMTAITRQDMPGFVRLAIIYVAVFAATTAVAVLYRFAEERLGLLWRSWLTTKVVERYLQDRVFYHLKESAAIENPDQRIADDIRAFTSSTLSFALIFLNGTLAAVSFSGVLWAISPMLFFVAVGYSLLGTIFTIYMGRPLVWLNYHQSDCEADFRASLIHVRENAESIIIQRREGRLRERLLNRVDALVNNFRKITSVNRNLGFFTTGYNYLIQIIPTLIIAPQFIRGEIEFGVVTQSSMAFAQLLGAFSLIVNQFGAISTFAAVIARLGALSEALEFPTREVSAVETVEANDRVAFEHLTLRSPQDGSILIHDLSATIPIGTRVLVTGPNENARTALFRAVADIRSIGEGRLVRPPLDDVLFLPQRPYLAPGTLREVLLRSQSAHAVSDDEIKAALHEKGLDSVLDRANGMDLEMDWAAKLSLSEQQLLAMVRLALARPKFVLLDRASTTLGQEHLQRCLEQLTRQAITFVVFEESSDCKAMVDAELRIESDGQWKWQSFEQRK